MRLFTSVFSLVLLLPVIVAKPIAGESDSDPGFDKALTERQLNFLNRSLAAPVEARQSIHNISHKASGVLSGAPLNRSSIHSRSENMVVTGLGARNLSAETPGKSPVAGSVKTYEKRANVSTLDNGEATPTANATLVVQPTNFHTPSANGQQAKA